MNLLLKWLRDLPLRTALLIALLVLSILPLVGMATHAYRRAVAISEEFSAAYSLILLQELARSTEQTLAQMERVSTMLFPEIEIQRGLRLFNEGSISAVEQTVEARRIENLLMNVAVANTYIRSIELISLNGRIFDASYGGNVERLPFTAEERMVVEARRGGLIWLPGTHAMPMLRLARLVRDLDSVEPLGYLIITYRNDAIQSVYQELADYLKREFDGEVLVLDRDGTIISHSDDARLMTVWDNPDVLALVQRSGSGTAQIIRDAGREVYIVQHPIDRPDWSMVLRVPRHSYDADIRELRDTLFFMTGVLALFALAAALVLARAFSAPILRLAEFMRRVPRERERAIPVFRGRNEIGVLHEEFQSMLEETERLNKTVYREELLLKRAELEALRMQINPHFLYNTLESINWMARLHQVPVVGKMAKALGDFTRASISGADFVTVAEDLISIRNYLTVQELRYEDKLSVEISIRDDLKGAIVPKLILQPVLENAITHGIEPKLQPGKVHISVEERHQVLTISVVDDGVGMSEQRLSSIRNDLESSGHDAEAVGLANVHRRIRFYYGDAFGLGVRSREGEGTTVEVQIPFSTSEPPDRFSVQE
jgi:two-component system sensor histidine kinase YesM